MMLWRVFVIGMLLIVGSGCSAFYEMVTANATCSMNVWHRQIDELQTTDYVERHQTGDEYALVGIVLDADTCMPIVDATVLFDMTNAEGVYDGTQRGIAYTNAHGIFMIQSNRPGAYNNGVPHIHFFIGATGYQPITASQDLYADDAAGFIEIILSSSVDA